jgi:predicted transcriptional regulator
MDDIVDLFDPRLAARQTDVDTSHDAAESMIGVAGKQHQAILNAMMRFYRPMAAEEIADQIDGLDQIAINRRLPELQRAGKIERTEEKYLNRSGRNAYRYRLFA